MMTLCQLGIYIKSDNCLVVSNNLLSVSYLVSDNLLESNSNIKSDNYLVASI